MLVTMPFFFPLASVSLLFCLEYGQLRAKCPSIPQSKHLLIIVPCRVFWSGRLVSRSFLRDAPVCVPPLLAPPLVDLVTVPALAAANSLLLVQEALVGPAHPPYLPPWTEESGEDQPQTDWRVRLTHLLGLRGSLGKSSVGFTVELA